MRNRIFAVIFCALLLTILAGAPLKLALTHAGILESENVGNVIEVDRVYDGTTPAASLLNAIEEVKRDMTDIYTNYMPLYGKITEWASQLQLSLNQPVTAFLLDRGNELTRLSQLEKLPPETTAPETTRMPETIAPQPDSTEPENETHVTDTTPPETTVEITTEPETTEPPFEVVARTVYLKANTNHRYYKIWAQTAADADPIEFLVRIPAADANQLRPAMQAQLNAINDFAARRPEVNWYVFPVTCFEDTELCDLVLPSESKHALFDEFFTGLDESIQYSYIPITTFDEKDRLYYRTDHHWNVYGYTEGYRLITAMFQENYADITPMTPVIHTYDDRVTMYGSNALATANYSLCDIFHAAEFPLAAHTVERETGVGYAGTRSIEESLTLYENGGESTARGYSHYMNFYPICRKITYTDNSTGRNLLIIGDSYTPPLHEALASHFDTTIIRYVDTNTALTTIDYEELIDQYGITDVLLFEMSDRVIYNYYGDALKNLR